MLVERTRVAVHYNKSKAMRTIVITRSNWARGAGDSAYNTLLNSYTENVGGEGYEPTFKNNSMCCLGFMCLQLGALPEDIKNQEMPKCAIVTQDRSERLLKLLAPLAEYNESMNSIQSTPLASKAAALNDDESLEESEREEALLDLFLENGFKLEFVD